MRSRFSKTLFVTISTLALGMTALSGTAAAQGNELITKDSFAGDPLQWDSFDPSVSADGNVTAFVSYASELVPGGIGGFSYIYVHDKTADTIQRIDHVNADGGDNFGTVSAPFISANGQYVVFRYSDNAIEDPERVYFYDRSNGNLERVAAIGVLGEDPDFNRVSVSDDGNKIAYVTTDRPQDSADTNNAADIFVYDRTTQTDTRITWSFDGQETDGHSLNPMISGDGQTIIFYSEAPNISEFGLAGLYKNTLSTGTTAEVALDGQDASGNYRIISDGYISSNGDYIAFAAELRNSFDFSNIGQGVYLFDQTASSEETLAEHFNDQYAHYASISVSDDGNQVLYGTMELIPELIDVPEANLYILDRSSGQTRLVSSRSAYWKEARNGGRVNFGQQISRDGTTITFPTAVLAPGASPVSAFNLYTGAASPSGQSPIADAGPNVLHFGSPVQLDGTGSSDDTTALLDLNYNWEYVTLIGPELPTDDIVNPNTPTPTIQPDFVLLRLTVSDQDGLFSNTDYVLVEAGNTPPSANAGPDQSINLGDTVTLTGSGFDADGDSLSYSWSLASKPSGSSATLSGTTESIDFSPDLAGTYYARFEVFDGFETASDLARITVTDPLAYASDQVTAARDIVAGLSRSDFDSRKRQNELLGDLDDILAAIGLGDNAGAISGIDALLPRLDGCAANGSADTKGKQKDWIVTCSAQTQVQNLLLDAKSIL